MNRKKLLTEEDVQLDEGSSYGERLRAKFFNALVASKKIRPHHNVERWALQFEKLPGQLGLDPDHVEHVLEQYIERLGEKGVPVITSPTGLRQKWPRIVNELSCNPSEKKKKQPPTEVAISMTRTFIRKGWSEEDQSVLLDVVDDSLKNVILFHRSSRRLLQKIEDQVPVDGYIVPEKKTMALIARRVGFTFTPALRVVETWIDTVHREISRWSERKKPLTDWTWSPTHPLWVKVEFAPWCQGLGVTRNERESFTSEVQTIMIELRKEKG